MDERVASLDEFSGFDFGKYELSQLLGRGTYGEVWRAKQDDGLKLENDSNHENEYVAMKIIKPDKATKENFHAEVSTLRSVKHPNIIEIFGACTSPVLAVLTEYMECGSLDHLLHKCGHIEYTVNHVFCWAIQCALALSYLHSRGIAHGDLKPANMLLCDGYRLLKLSDFGTAARLFKDEEYRHGSAPWMAPEAFSGERPEKISGCPEYMMSLIERCWDEEPMRRPDTSYVHSFLIHAVDCTEDATYGSRLQPLSDESNESMVGDDEQEVISNCSAAPDNCMREILPELHEKLRKNKSLPTGDDREEET